MLDSFDHYATADIELKWGQLYGQSARGSGSTAISAGTGRRGTSSLRMRCGASNVGGACEPIARFFGSTAEVCIVGFAFKASGLGAFVTNISGNYLYPFAGFQSLNPVSRNTLLLIRSGNWTMVGFTLESNGTIMAWRGEDAGTTEAGFVHLGTSDIALQPNQWYYLEFKVLIDESFGTVELKINGATQMNLTGQDTYIDPTTGGFLIPYPAPPIGWDEIVIGHLTAGNAVSIGQNVGEHIWDFDDLYVADGSVGTATNDVSDFWGDHRIDARRVTADGAMTQMTPLSGTDHFDMVDDLTQDGDTTYNSELTAGQIDTFVVENAPAAGYDVDAVQVVYLARRSQEGTSVTKPVLRSGGSNYSGAGVYNTQTYDYHWGIWTKDPADNGVISDTDWNAMEVGVEKDA